MKAETENSKVISEMSVSEMTKTNGGFPWIPVIALFIECWDAADGIAEGWNSVK